MLTAASAYLAKLQLVFTLQWAFAYTVMSDWLMFVLDLFNRCPRPIYHPYLMDGVARPRDKVHVPSKSMLADIDCRKGEIVQKG